MVATPVVWLRKIPITKCFMCLGSWWWNSWVLQPFTDVSIQLQVIHALLKCWTILVRICWRHVGLSRKPWLQLPAMRLVKFILIRWGVGPFAYLCIHNAGSCGAHCLPPIRKARMQWNTSTQRQSLLISHPKSGSLHRCRVLEIEWNELI